VHFAGHAATDSKGLENSGFHDAAWTCVLLADIQN
jgi:hypothetical protein